MRLLLDTHVAVWLMLGMRDRLRPSAADALADVDNTILLSAVSVWEIAVKRSIGKLGLDDNWPKVLTRFGFEALPINAEHAAAVEHLPLHHRDPFDRLLVAVATVEQATLVTADRQMSMYDVPRLGS